MNKRVVVIAVPHAEFGNLYLHGLRRDNGKWALPGGHMVDGETPLEAANRELREETGLTNVRLSPLIERDYDTEDGVVTVHLFQGQCNAQPKSENDPDQEFLSFKFLDPNESFKSHVPQDQNILLEHLKLNKSLKNVLTAGAVGLGMFMSSTGKADATHVRKYLDGLKNVPGVTVQHNQTNPNIKATNSNLKIGNFNVKVKALGGGLPTTLSNHSIELHGPKNQSQWSNEDHQNYANAKHLYNHLQTHINQLMDMNKSDDGAAASLPDLNTETFSNPIPKAKNKKSSKKKKTDSEENTPLTVKGVKVNSNPNIKSITNSIFDSETGTLHTPKGSFSISIPSLKDQNYQKILSSSDIQDLHRGAMKNWFRLHDILRSGEKLPEEVIAHAVIFSQLSANTPVPLQELMYSRLVDVMREKNFDPTSPDFQQEFGKKGSGRKAWFESDNPTEFPNLAREYWTGRAKPTIIQKEKSKTTGRNAGDIYKFVFKNESADVISQYPKLHNYIVNTISKHGGNTQKIVSEMMADKSLKDNLPENHPMKLPVRLGSKISRYAMSMLGSGTSVIPDTHFVRHLFGLDSQTDSKTSEHLKDVLWKAENHHILNQIDEFYQKRHPAVRFVVNKYFDGIENENSNFPAFWLHWLSIAPHEKSLGIGKPKSAKNLTDHTPYFEVVNEILDRYKLGKLTKSEKEVDLPVYYKTAAALHEIKERLGSEAALMFYYKYLVPVLLKSGLKKADFDQFDDFNFESLAKGEAERKQQFMQMVNNDAKHEPAATFASKMPNSNWGVWYMRNYKLNPEKASHPETLSTIQHHLDLAGVSPQHYKKLQFDKSHDLDLGIQAFKDIESEQQRKRENALAAEGATGNKNPNSKRMVDPKGVKMLDLGNNWAWHNLQTKKCTKEADAMGHCGTTQLDTIISLRKEHKFPDGTIKHEPFITASMTKNGELQEIKAAGNKKPEAKWHKAILALLHSDHIKSMDLPGGFNPSSDFQLDDLDPKHLDELLKLKPNISKYYATLDQREGILASPNKFLHIRNLNKILSLEEWKNIHVNAANSESFKDKELLSTNPSLHPEAQNILAQDYDDVVRLKLAKNPKLTPEAINRLAQDIFSKVRFNLSYNPNLTPEAINRLAQDTNPDIRYSIAQKPNLTPELMNLLAQDKSWSVKSNLAEHPNLTPEAMNLLAQDEINDVRANLAEHPNLTPELMNLLAQDTDFRVKSNLAKNPKLTPELMNLLGRDKTDYVRAKLAEHPKLTPELMNFLARDKTDYVRESLAEHPKLTPELMNFLARDSNFYVKAKLAKHPNLTPEAQNILNLNKSQNYFQNLRKTPIIHDDPKKPMQIIRIQNEQGEGPYTSDADIDLPWLADQSAETGHPAPSSDRGFNKEDLKALNNFESPQKLFGFKDEEEMNRWFSPEQLEDLKSFGFKPVKTKAARVWGSGRQIFFEKYVKPLRQNKIMAKTENENQKEVTEEEVKNHINNICPHANNPTRNARLHALTEGQKWIKTKIPLSSIKEKAHSLIDVNKYKKMIEQGSVPPAVVLTSLGQRPDGTHIIASIQDGAHRIAAAKAAGLTHIDAYVGDYDLEKSLLEKSLKEKYQSMMKDHPQGAEIADWARSTLPNENWGTWYLRNVKNNPAIHNEQNKKDLQHLSGMMHLPEVSSFRFDKTTLFEDGIKKLKEAEKSGVNRTVSSKKLIPAEGTQISTGKNGMFWFDLGRGSCKKEAEAMGHCGNVPTVRKNDRILSLRKIVNIGGQLYHEPHLTFIENNGWLGEMKGKANKRPEQKYHDNILDLIKLDRIKHLAGGGFQPAGNFHLSDLNLEQQEELKKLKPNLDVWNLDPEEELKLDVPEKHQEDVKKLLSYRRDIKDEILKSKKTSFFGPKPTISNEEIRSTILDKIKRTNEVSNYPRAAAQLLDKTPKLALNLVSNLTDTEIDSILRSDAFNDHKIHALGLSRNPEHLDYIYSDSFTNDKRFSDSEKYDLQETALDHDKINTNHLAKALQNKSRHVRAYAYTHEKMPSDLLERQYIKYDNHGYGVSNLFDQQNIVKAPNAPANIVVDFLTKNLEKMPWDSTNQRIGFEEETDQLLTETKFKPETQIAIINKTNKGPTIAENPNLTLEAQSKLAHDRPNPLPSQLGLAKNPSVHPEIQKILVNQNDLMDRHRYQIDSALMANPNLDPEIQEKLMHRYKGLLLTSSIQKMFFGNPNNEVVERYSQFIKNLPSENLGKSNPVQDNYSLSVESFRKPELLPGGVFNPKKHDFTVKIHGPDGNQIGFMTVSHHFLHPKNLMTYQFEIDKQYRGQGFGTKLARHAEQISGKKLMATPDMTPAGKAFAQKYALKRKKT